MLNVHPKKAAPLVAGLLLEHIALFGIQSVLLFEIIYNSQSGSTNISSWYEYHEITKYLAFLLGGSLGLIHSSRTWLLVGGILEVLGTLILFSGQPSMMLAGMFTLAVGAGLFFVNTYSIFLKTYLKSKASVISGAILIAGLTSLAHYLGVKVFNLILEETATQFVILSAVVLFAIATFLSYFYSDDSKVPHKRIPEVPIGNSVFIILILILFKMISWIVVRIHYNELQNLNYPSDYTLPEIIDGTLLWTFTAIGASVTAFLFFLLFPKSKIKAFTVLGFSFILLSISSSLLLIPVESKESLKYLIWVQYIILMLIEVLMVPAIVSIYTAYSRPKILVLIVGIISCSLIIMRLWGYDWIVEFFKEKSKGFTFTTLAVSMLVIGVVVFFFNSIFKIKSPYEIVEETPEEKLAGFKDGDLLD